MDLLLWILAILLVATGIAGIILPGIPSALAVFAGLLVAAAIDGFHRVSVFTVVLLGILTIASFGLDYLLAGWGARKAGAGKEAAIGGAIGAVAGVFFGVPGLIIGPFVGAFIGEYIARKDLRQAGKAGLGTWLGIVVGMAVKIALIGGMVGVFLTAYVF
jgi:uncharacterized protein YqgC (DUF456 family)